MTRHAISKTTTAGVSSPRARLIFLPTTHAVSPRRSLFLRESHCPLRWYRTVILSTGNVPSVSFPLSRSSHLPSHLAPRLGAFLRVSLSSLRAPASRKYIMYVRVHRRVKASAVDSYVCNVRDSRGCGGADDDDGRCWAQLRDRKA